MPPQRVGAATWERDNVDRDQVSVRLVGGFELRHGDVPVDVPLSSERLLGFLALSQRPLPRGYVAATLWPDTTDERAAANLRTALWRLHRPGFELLCVTSGRLSLHPDVRVDVRVLHAAADEHRRNGRLPAADVLADARGELLPGCWDGWLVYERERLRQETVGLLEAACAACLERREPHLAVLHALAAVECDPLRESANTLVLRAHLADGNRVAALLQARQYTALLRDELGVAPSRSFSDELEPVTVG